MKAQSPFWPLLKNELAIGRYGGAGQVVAMLLMYWIVIGALPLLVMYGDNNSHGNIASLFEAGFLPIVAFLFVSVLTLWISYATVPAFNDLLSPGGAIPGAMQHSGAFEFLFTRAVDRRVFFRARTTAFFLFALTPLFLNLAVSPFAPEISFGPTDSTSSGAILRQEQYLRAFPASHPAGDQASSGEIGIPHGAVAYTAWLAWSGTLVLVLLQAYGTLIARRVKSNNGWTAIFAGAPIGLLLISLVLAARGFLKTRISIYENCFLLFSTHPLALVIFLVALAVVVQAWCERRFSELEIF